MNTTNTPHTIYLSNGHQYSATLRVYRDWTNSNGQWRLFWEDPAREGCGVDEQSTVTGQPFFRTMREAIAHGQRRYNITATKGQW
jgi:hypothetical protein